LTVCLFLFNNYIIPLATDEVPEEIYELEKTDLIRLQMSSEKYKVAFTASRRRKKK